MDSQRSSTYRNDVITDVNSRSFYVNPHQTHTKPKRKETQTVMKYCSKCGNALQDNADICMNCGCRAEGNKFTVTFKRESQWFLINPAMKVNVVGPENTTLSIKSGEIQSVTLVPGTYQITVTCSFRTNRVDLVLNRNVAYRLAFNRFSGAIEFWEI